MISRTAPNCWWEVSGGERWSRGGGERTCFGKREGGMCINVVGGCCGREVMDVPSLCVCVCVREGGERTCCGEGGVRICA